MGASRARYEWIDLLRGAAVVGMVWTHAANTFLDASLQATRGYAEMSYYHGLVAPTFFWLAGYMRGLSAARPGPRKPAGHTIRRLLMILATGYLLHLPWLVAVHWQINADVLRVLLQSDVLQCLAVSCLLLLVVERALPRALAAWVAAALGIAVVLVTPTMAETATGIIPLDAYLSKQNGSLFPLFPWAAFACAGFVVGETRSMGWALGFAAALAAFGLPWVPGHSSTFSFFFERLGWVTMIAVLVKKGCSYLLNRNAALPRWLLLAGRNSLVVYVAHLVLIYATPFCGGRTLEQYLGPTQPPWVVAGFFVCLLLASLLPAWGNDWRNARRKKNEMAACGALGS